MSATSVVEKATSDMLIGPDWALNLDLCDAINNDPSQAKEVVKAVKKRLTNRNAQVQLLALTVLETLIKNCGDNVHQQVAEKDVLHELVKIVKKKADMRVRDKILVLIDSWQEAFGGSSGRFPQYYMAYKELQKAGVEFPRRGGESSVPIFTPPQSQPISSPRPPPHSARSSGPRPHSPRSPRPPPHSAWSSGPPPMGHEDIDNVSGMEYMGLADIKSARNLAEICSEMVSALNPRDRMSAREEVIVEIVDQCRMNQRRVMQLVNETSDEELLGQGLSLNDELQRVLARYDAFLSGAPLPESFSESRARSPPRAQDQPEAQSSYQGAGGSARPRGSSRTTIPARPLAPPPSTGKRPAPQSAVSAQPADATFDLLSGDPEYNLLSDPASSAQPEASSSSMALTVIDQPQRTAQDDLLALTVIDQPQRTQEDLLGSPAPEAHTNPFESSPFQATPHTDATSSPVYPPQNFQQRVGASVPSAENSWSPAPVVGNPRQQQSSFYGEVPTQPTISGQSLQSQPQYYYPPPQPVTTTPPPWQEDTEAVQAPLGGQQWQGASQGYGYGGNSSQMYYSGQQLGMGGMQPQYPGAGYSGFATQTSLPSFQFGQLAPNELPRFGSVGTGPGGNFGNQYLNQRGIYGQSSGLGTSQQYSGASNASLKSPDTLFHDLVDLRSVSAQMKGASLANKTANTTKAGP